MTELAILENKDGRYMEYNGVVLKYEHTREEGYGEYDFFDMNPAALKGPTTVYHTFRIGDFEMKYEHDISGPHSNLGIEGFFARDCVDGKGFEIIAKTPYSETVLGIVEIA